MKTIQLAGCAALCLAAFSGTAVAQDIATDLPRLSSEYVKDEAVFKIAANESGTPSGRKDKSPAAEKPAKAEPPLFTGNRLHQYLGIATVAAAAGAFVTHHHPCEGPNCGPQPPRKTHDLHANLGRAAGVLALATAASGLISHWDDFHAEDGISDPDNLHVLLGASSAVLMAYAVNKSIRSSTPTPSHAHMAVAGSLGMVVAIKLTW